jgi:DNA polymerase V
MASDNLSSPGKKITYELHEPAGLPSRITGESYQPIDLNKELIPHPQSTFIIESSGYSMINAFIPPKARLLVDRSLAPKNGDIVLAVINGEFTVKFLKKNNYKCWLVPANSKFKEIEITWETDMHICGVVTNIITNTNDVRFGMY